MGTPLLICNIIYVFGLFSDLSIDIPGKNNVMKPLESRCLDKFGEFGGGVEFCSVSLIKEQFK